MSNPVLLVTILSNDCCTYKFSRKGLILHPVEEENDWRSILSYLFIFFLSHIYNKQAL